MNYQIELKLTVVTNKLIGSELQTDEMRSSMKESE